MIVEERVASPGGTAVIVFVHGVPETAAIWAKVRRLVDQESVALALPGFGCPRPEGFAATKEDYVEWLLGELDRIDGPIDLVGHDWGAGLTYRVATAYGDRLHSWAADVANLAHPDYTWHDFAKIWQTPGEGEAFFESQNALPAAERAGLFELMGVPGDDALEMAEASDATMGDCILALYRSATPNPSAHWGPWQPTSAPGLVLHPTEDVFGDEKLAREVADTLGAGFAPLEGAGHFWPYQAPEQGAAALQSFWSTLA
jgi:pimeloyl-ACP methyl ester carboxylesterase